MGSMRGPCIAPVGRESGRESGQAAVESALVMPLAVFLILGTLQLFMLLQGRIMAEYAAWRAVRRRGPTNGTRSALIRWPRMPSSAGTSVIEVSTAYTTEMPVTQPSVRSSGNPASRSALSAMMTVPPAKTTAPPELATVRRTDSCTGTPSASRRRWRDSRNSA